MPTKRAFDVTFQHSTLREPGKRMGAASQGDLESEEHDIVDRQLQFLARLAF